MLDRLITTSWSISVSKVSVKPATRLASSWSKRSPQTTTTSTARSGSAARSSSSSQRPRSLVRSRPSSEAQDGSSGRSRTAASATGSASSGRPSLTRQEISSRRAVSWRPVSRRISGSANSSPAASASGLPRTRPSASSSRQAAIAGPTRKDSLTSSVKRAQSSSADARLSR